MEQKGICTDNFFASYNLEKLLLENNLAILGTIPTHRRKIPSNLSNRMKLYSSKFLYHCSKLVTTNRLLCMHLLRYCKVFRKCIFTRYRLAADSAGSAFPPAAQRLPAPMKTACNNFAFFNIFFMYRLSVVPSPN